VAETKKQLAEKRIRERIRQAFSRHHRSAGTMKAIEDEMVKLIEDYCSAPDSKKEEVYERGEKRLIRAVRSDSAHR
jgi:hypothetical protein